MCLWCGLSCLFVLLQPMQLIKQTCCCAVKWGGVHDFKAASVLNMLSFLLLSVSLCGCCRLALLWIGSMLHHHWWWVWGITLQPSSILGGILSCFPLDLFSHSYFCSFISFCYGWPVSLSGCLLLLCGCQTCMVPYTLSQLPELLWALVYVMVSVREMCTEAVDSRCCAMFLFKLFVWASLRNEGRIQRDIVIADLYFLH